MFREITLNWDNKEYRILPTMELLVRVEEKFSLPILINRVLNGDSPISHVSYVISCFLQYGGAMVSSEDVYKEILTSEDQEIAIKLMLPIMQALEPEIKNEKALATKKKKKTTSRKKR